MRPFNGRSLTALASTTWPTDEVLDSSRGAVTVDLKGISDTNTSLQNQIDDMNTRLDTEEQSLLIQFEQVDALLRSYPTTMDQISAVLASLPSASINSSSK